MADETNKAPKDSVETSKGKEGSTSEPTFTREERDKAVSDALAKAGRTAKEFEGRTSLLDTREQRVKDSEAKETERQKARDVKELEDAAGDSEKLTIIQQGQRLRGVQAELDKNQTDLKKREEEFAADKAKNQVDIDAANATKLESDIFTIAKKHGVDPMQLKDFGISDLKQLEEIAKAISVKKPFTPDSLKTTGGGEITEQQRLDKLYPTMAKKS